MPVPRLVQLHSGSPNQSDRYLHRLQLQAVIVRMRPQDTRLEYPYIWWEKIVQGKRINMVLTDMLRLAIPAFVRTASTIN